MTQENNEATLKKALNLFEVTLGGVGIILGAGIYALVGAVAAEAGNGLWASFLLAAIVAIVIGLCYAELASMFPHAGADYEYTRVALGERPAFVVGWLMVIGNIVAAAAVALGFAGYLSTFVSINETLAAIGILTIAAIIAFIGIQQTFWLTIAGTLVEVGGLLFIIAIGIPDLPDVDLRPDQGASGVASGAALVMFAYLGFSQIATLAEETEDAARVVPRAMLLSILITTALYMTTAIAALAVLGSQALSESEGPLAEVAGRVLGDNAEDLVALIALFSTANTMLLLLVAASRLIYGMASREALPRFLAWVHRTKQTPVRAIVLSLLLAWAFALTGELAFVAGATNFAVFVGFAAACVSLAVLRLREPSRARPFRVPGTIRGVPIVPVAGLVLTAVLMAHLDLSVLLVGGVLFMSGVAAMELLSLWRPHGRSS